MGMETGEIMRGANTELRRQRDDVVKIHKTTNQIAMDIERSDRLIKQMTLREFYKKLMLYGTIILLFFAIILTFLLKLLR
jgi:hypothetical protein